MCSDAQGSVVPKESVAVLETVEFEKLLNLDPVEQVKLLLACQKQGFFYLHLPQDGNRELWAQTKSIMAVMKEFLEQPVETKMKYHLASSGSAEIYG
jgi:isopenicillin N synthase-like dioxygenase